MSDVVDSAKRGLSGKIGPVPVWAIAAGLGVVSVGGYYVYARKSAATATNTPAAVGATADGTVASYSTAGYNTANDSSTATDTATTTDTGYANNASWLIAAATAVARATNQSFFDVSVALTKYLQGSTITPGQKSLVDMAVGLKGYPPDGVDAISDVADPTAVAPGSATSNTTSPVIGADTETPTPQPVTQPVQAANYDDGVYVRLRNTYDVFRKSIDGQWKKLTQQEYINYGAPQNLPEVASSPIRYVRPRFTYDVYKWNDGVWNKLTQQEYVNDGAPQAEEVSDAPI